MDASAMFKISYGLYVLSASEGPTDNACIINTLSQVTSSPNRISVTVNKSNFTHSMIARSGKFNVSIISEDADFELFKRFGFSTGRFENKFHRFAFMRAENGIPFIPSKTSAYISGKVVSSVELGTHTMFIADVTDAKLLSDTAPMTYAYYHAKVKPKPEAPKADDGERWVCKICGYVHEGKLPDDFVCPICKHSAEDFEKVI